MRLRSRLATAAIGVLLVLSTSACDPYFHAPDGVVEASIDISADGDASTKVFLDCDDHSDAELLEFGEEWATAITTKGTYWTVTINDNSGGCPFAEVLTSGAFTPGTEPNVAIDTRAATEWSLSHGAESVSVSLSLPWVSSGGDLELNSSSGRGVFVSGIVDPDDAPVGTVTLHPEASAERLLLSTGLGVAALVGLVVLILATLRRKRAPGVVSGALTLGVAVAALALSPGEAAEQSVVAGADPGMASLSLALILTMPLIVLGSLASLVALAARTSASPVQFTPPPGWPSPQEGWLPKPSWQPDPSWPIPAATWPFVQPIPRRHAQSSHSADDWRAAREWQREYRTGLRNRRRSSSH